MPESQTVGTCAALRENCQRAIFAHIDSRHGEVMDKLGEIERAAAFESGRRAAGETGGYTALRERWGLKEWALLIAALCTMIGAGIAGAVAAVRSIDKPVAVAKP